jgi:hypothetical protein
MVAAAAAIIGSLATVAGVGSSIAAQAGRKNNTGDQQYALEMQQLADARDNEQYQRMVSAMINQRAIAGQTDSMGNKLEYDPATNTWRSSLGALPQAAQTAAEQASISRNTTDLRGAQFANEQAARRATQAGPAADAALRELQANRPMGSDELVGLLQRQGTNAARETFDPLRADTLRQFQRAGSAAGPVLAQLGKQEYSSLKDTLLDAQIKGMTNIGGINQAKRQGLEQSAANAATLANPQFQYPGIQPRTDDMAKTVAARAQQSAAIPAYGMGGVNTAAGNVRESATGVKVPAPMNNLETIGNTLQKSLGDRDAQKNFADSYKAIKGWFGSDPPGGPIVGDPYSPSIYGQSSPY